MPTIGQVAVLALVLWLVQLALSYRQARLFTRRITELRKLGLCATGLAGGAYRGRAYVALVANPLTHRIIKAELLQGLTVFARLKPVTPLEGYSIDELLNDQPPSVAGISPKVIAAARSAAEAIQKSLAKAPTGA
jgi:DNA-binding transcriptional regulator of glucitol operon